MSKGLQYAIRIIQMNLDKPADELKDVLKHYISELEELANVGSLQ